MEKSSVRLGYKNKFRPANELGASLGKLPPQAIDLEETVLGALMLKKMH